MFRKLFALVALGSALGCAGNNILHGPTPFEGAYAGSWGSTTEQHAGTWSSTINSSSDMEGSFTDSTTGQTGLLLGDVDVNGNFFADVNYNGGGKIHIRGIMALGGSGLTGNGSYSIDSGQAQPFTFDLAKH
jgi:hypothetical protein